ncbi:M23 family metallopeptidase [Emergencia sp. 1XD21-10]|uniref:M23 family metallopeptidase n=1 Tax=Emergencia sp. 1XD21-10 TaxID=2304569 RepID=UPI00137A58FC|nr:M23 family metallopeptidase [Emergencia sp. 1XD21-10]
MRQAEKKKGKDKVAAVLMLCFCLIALVSIFTIKSSIDKIAKSAGDVPAATETPTKPQLDEQTSPAEEALDENENSEETASNIPTVDSQKQTKKKTAFASPMDMSTAKISKEYSMDMVIYNLTLDQYMTHPGLDFEAPQGSGVKAVADGTITEVYTDDAYGITIEITHQGGYISRYCNLATDKLCEKGDTVKKGQVISNIGKSALYESMDKAHLHFEILKNGKVCDPTKVISD